MVSMSGSLGPMRTTPMSPQPTVPSTESRRRYRRAASCMATTKSSAGKKRSELFVVAMHEAARLYRRRDSVDGTVGWGDMGVVRIGPKDPDIETMIAPYLAVVFA